MSNPGGNAFATNNSGGGVGITTAQPSLTGGWQNPLAGAGYRTVTPGQPFSYNTPDWLQAGLYYANQPISNLPITNYGRWNWNGGNTNGYGMVSSPWPSPQSLFGALGVPGNGPGGAFSGGTGAPTPGGTGALPGMLPPTAAPPPATGTLPTGAPLPPLIGTGTGGNGNFPGATGDRLTLREKAALGMPNAIAALGAQSPTQVQAAASALQGMGPAQQAQWLRANPNMARALLTGGLFGQNAYNNLFAGSETQSLSGQPLRGY